ncbi:MAG: hypothetical protein RBR01_05585 [Desulfobacterales bacterium]|jgi:hypothetical protein|nr:hypothetical protein [Desulfobacterales bacterium]MDD3081726.1 hypothetical protein [Desulfobacterales bacterium]MDD3950147.1 hypothetical protein [Desulfobacterales bacterium]MDY0377891.1 hypothetical protein [Desulfobacterales bacterium]
MIDGRCIRPSSESIKSYPSLFYFRAFCCFLPYPEFTGNKDFFLPEAVDFSVKNLSGGEAFLIHAANGADVLVLNILFLTPGFES